MTDSGPTRIDAAGVAVDRRARTRRNALEALAAAGVLVLALGLAFGFTLLTAVFVAGLLAGLVGLVAFFMLIAANARAAPLLHPHAITIDGATLRTRGRSFALADVVQGFREDPDLVRLAMKNGEVLVMRVPDVAERDRVLRAAGVTAAERVLRVPLASAASQVPGGSVFGSALLALMGSTLLFALVTLGYAMRDMAGGLDGTKISGFSLLAIATSLIAYAVYGITAALARREVVVGTDGIAYRKTLRTEFIPYSALANVAPDTRGVRLVRKNGRKLVLPTRRSLARPLPLAPAVGPPATEAEAQRRVLLERIAEAMGSGEATGLAQVALDRLDRSGRSPEAWREDLSKLLAPEGDYRRARISVEDLGGVIEDPSAPVERRVAAAVALAAREGEEAKRRVRIAVRASADEDLQGALEAAAEGEIDEARLARAAARRA